MIVKISEQHSAEIRRTDPHRHKYGSALAEYLDLKGADFEDESTGSVEYQGHAQRFGRRILWTDQRGFVDVDEWPTEEEATEAIAKAEAAYYAWEQADEA